MTKWRCCKNDPPETGKKVLCHQKGDIYVAYRLLDRYIPTPFVDHYFSPNLSYPETWSEIDFPEGLFGRLMMGISGEDELLSLAEFEVKYPEEFRGIAKMLIDSMGTLKKPDGDE